MVRKQKVNIVEYLGLKKVGWFEMLFALTLMLSGRGLAGLPLSALLWILMLVLSFFKPKRNSIGSLMPLVYLSVYCVLHNIAFLSIGGNLNACIIQIVYFLSIFYLYRVLDMDKLVGSLNWVAIINILGLLYQWMVIVRGDFVHPIEIPGLTMPENRLDGESIRPAAFFMEPAAYVAFIFAPLALALARRKYIWAVVLILSSFLTTSTTGILSSFIFLIAYVFTQGVSMKRKFLILLMGGALAFALFSIDAFEGGVTKMEKIGVEGTRRLVDGPHAVGTMRPGEFVFGAFYPSAYEYCLHRAPMVTFKHESVFLSTFWLIILTFGLIGLILYLMVYWKLYKNYRITRPFIVCLFAVMFSSSYGIFGIYVFTTIILLCMAANEQKLLTENSV